jgi:TolB-like protein/DNA-binding winged helix-turn-helix (wHTH) protein/Tfp pilus assembly protein PilF
MTLLEFGPFRVDPRRRELRNGETLVPLPPKAFDVLMTLLEQPGETVAKERIMQTVWPDTFVEEGNLTQSISILRKALGETADGQAYIITVPKQGYRFVGQAAAARRRDGRSRRWLWLAGGAAAIVLLGVAAIRTAARHDSSTITSIAVLPFADVNPNHDMDYFCDGIADELIDALSRIPGLRVIARGSSFQFKKRNEDARAIAARLGVQAVLDGTVRRDGDQLHVTAELVDARDASRLWSGSFDRKGTDIFGVQRAISRLVAGALRLRAGDEAYTPPRYTTDIATYDLYLQGRSALGADPVRAAEFLSKAIEANSNYAPAYAGLADAYARMWLAPRNPNETLPKAQQAMERALRLDERLPEAHYSKAGILTRNWDWSGALHEIDRAIALNPSLGPALWRRGELLLYTGREREARDAFEKAEAVDPMAPNLLALKIQNLFYMRRCDETIELAKQYAGDGNANYYLGRCYAEKGMLAEAIDLLEARRRITAGQGFGVLAGLYVRAGRRADALKLLDEARAMARHTYVKPSSMAQLFIGLGDLDEAFRWLDRAREEHDPTLATLRLESCWDPIRGDPRFQALLHQVNLDKL